MSAEEDQAVDGDSISVFLVLASRSEWTLCVARRISGVAGLGQVYTTGFTSVAFWRLARGGEGEWRLLRVWAEPGWWVGGNRGDVPLFHSFQPTCLTFRSIFFFIFFAEVLSEIRVHSLIHFTNLYY